MISIGSILPKGDYIRKNLYTKFYAVSRFVMQNCHHYLIFEMLIKEVFQNLPKANPTRMSDSTAFISVA